MNLSEVKYICAVEKNTRQYSTKHEVLYRIQVFRNTKLDARWTLVPPATFSFRTIHIIFKYSILGSFSIFFRHYTYKLVTIGFWGLEFSAIAVVFHLAVGSEIAIIYSCHNFLAKICCVLETGCLKLYFVK